MARWDKLKTRGNAEDRRGMSRPGVAMGGLGIVLILLFALFGGGGDAGLDQLIDQLQEPQRPPGSQPEEFAGEDDYEVFASTVLGSTDEV